MIGQTVSHYRILEKLGSGGMGVVYKAEDSKLKRDVALKFLPPELTRDEIAKRRFIHEAQTASALQHHNICTVHEIDQTNDGRLFISMDFYAGETLRERIARGPLPVEDALNVVVQIADGLSKAHTTGMVHRDIKPANVMVTTDGVVKVLDFGLAKLAGQTKVTKTGTAVGTLAYMSPEQATGGEIGPHSDVFALGVVLYELLSGRLPFNADHDAAMVYSIVNTEPEPLKTFRNDLPEGIQRVIDKALMKRGDERYPSAVELLADLRRIQEGQQVAALEVHKKRQIHIRAVLYATIALAVLYSGYVVFSRMFHAERIMLAVLPFENLGPAEDEYFADGITDEITARLAGILKLGVIARTSAIQYKNTDKSIGQIGEELGVDYILEGTIRWRRARDEPGRVRVTPQLIKVSDATHLWAQVYDEGLTEIFDVQTDIADKVVSALNITLLDPERLSVESKPTNSLEAFDFFLKGKEYDDRGVTDVKATRLAVQLYEKAVELDPKFTAAWARLSRACTELYWHAGGDDRDLATAKAAADSAMETGPETPDARLALASYYHHLRDYDLALEQLELAKEIQPNHSEVLAEIGYIQRRQGRYDLAISNIERAFELDPRSAILATNLGNSYLRVRDYAAAATCFERAISYNPDEDIAYGRMALLYVMRDGDTQAAQELLQEASALVKPTPWFNRTWAWVDACAGDYQTALKRYAIDDPASPGANYYDRAAMYRLLGESELARACYDSARVVLEQKVAAAPENARYHAGLGVAYAGLGRKTEAIQQGELAARLAPVHKDAHWNPAIAVSLARIYTMTGQYDAAIEQLKLVLSIPADLSAPLLRIDPTWSALWEHPTFQELVAER